MITKMTRFNMFQGELSLHLKTMFGHIQRRYLLNLMFQLVIFMPKITLS
ncbi:hypothetical protein BAMTA208_13265 [Bacillus amyloliquefaciens TA208]|nr:hypothetical protein BAMTA208_13265 [Bacillus amyloliquefaciens TA208]AEB64315.1 hypothetical protein LL3_02783 [Bacillus amyloliquefaciens LL3]